MKTYEAMFLLDNREVKKGWDPLKESIDSIMTKRGADILVAKRWDERKLAYDIKKQRMATYYLSYFKAEPEAIDEVRRDLELSVPVLRYLILSCDAIPEDAYEPEKEFTMIDEDEPASEEPADKEGSEDGADPEVEAVEKAVAEAGAVAEGVAVAAAEAVAETTTGEVEVEAVVDIAETEKPEENKE